MASNIMRKDLASVLPPAWTNVVASTTDKAVVIRSNIENIEDINDWVLDFGRKTQTKWNARMCHPAKQKFVCSKEFVCHHSNYNKRTQATSEGKKPTKNTHCRAKIRAKIKLYTQNTRYTDPFVLKRLCGVIVVELEHNHLLGTPESLRWLPADYKIKDMFLGYYRSGKRIAESCHYHERILKAQEECEAEGWLKDGRINPNQRIVRSWHDQWRRMNVPIEQRPETSEVTRPKRKRRKLSPFRLKPSDDNAGEDEETNSVPVKRKRKQKDSTTNLTTKNLRSKKSTTVIQKDLTKDVSAKDVQEIQLDSNSAEEPNLYNNPKKLMQNGRCNSNTNSPESGLNSKAKKRSNLVCEALDDSEDEDVDTALNSIQTNTSDGEQPNNPKATVNTDTSENGIESESLKQNNNVGTKTVARVSESGDVQENNLNSESLLELNTEQVDDSDRRFNSEILHAYSPDLTQESGWNCYIKLVVQKMRTIDSVISRQTVKEKLNKILTVALSGGYESRYSWLNEFGG